MANHKSALKRIRQNEKIRIRKSSQRSAVRTAIKKTRAAVEAGDKDGATDAFKKAEVALARGASKGLFHSGNASRRISRLAKLVNGMA